ncbi:MAG: type II secretion system protein, partial [Candidatus Omnitrophota bacterium]
MKKNSGFTLVEVLVTTAILTFAILSTLSLFSYLLYLAEGDRESLTQEYDAENQMEQIRAMDYFTIRDTYTNAGALRQTIMGITNGVDRSGVIYGQELAPNGLIRIKVAVCYLQRNRLIGEDANFNGALDSGEDANGNGELDSPCEIESVVVNKD